MLSVEANISSTHVSTLPESRSLATKLFAFSKFKIPNLLTSWHLACANSGWLQLGMSFGVKFKVRTFGNKHPDGSNVRNFSDHAIYMYYMYIYISVNRVLP